MDEMKEELEELQEFFEQCDENGNGDGLITLEALKQTLRNMDAEAPDEEVEDMFRWADKDGDGRLNYDEFIAAMGSGDEEEY